MYFCITSYHVPEPPRGFVLTTFYFSNHLNAVNSFFSIFKTRF